MSLFFGFLHLNPSLGNVLARNLLYGFEITVIAILHSLCIPYPDILV